MANQIRRSQWRLPESTTGQGRRGPDQRAVANFHFDRPPYVNHDIAVHNRVSDIEACAQVGVRQYGSVLNYAAAIDLTVVLNIRAACDDHTRPQSCVITYVCGTHDASPRMQAGAWRYPHTRPYLIAIGPDTAVLEQCILREPPEILRRTQSVRIFTMHVFKEA
jgi:hypothetical protein